VGRRRFLYLRNLLSPVQKKSIMPRGALPSAPAVSEGPIDRFFKKRSNDGFASVPAPPAKRLALAPIDGNTTTHPNTASTFIVSTTINNSDKPARDAPAATDAEGHADENTATDGLGSAREDVTATNGQSARESEGTASNLRLLAAKPGTIGRRGKPTKAGMLQIRDKASKILEKARAEPNPVASSLGLGDCLLVEPADRNRFNIRPCERISATLGNRAHHGHWFLSYHITWVAANGVPPLGAGTGSQYSHRCHRGWCVEPRHGVWETGPVNRARNVCAAGRSHYLLEGSPNGRYLVRWNCTHDPPCLAGTVVEKMEHPNITALPPGP
jgi:hypothetical protein